MIVPSLPRFEVHGLEIASRRLEISAGATGIMLNGRQDREVRRKRTADSRVPMSGIYLCEEGEYIGPFRSLDDAERFLTLILLSGFSCEGIEMVKISKGADRAKRRPI